MTTPIVGVLAGPTVDHLLVDVLLHITLCGKDPKGQVICEIQVDALEVWNQSTRQCSQCGKKLLLMEASTMKDNSTKDNLKKISSPEKSGEHKRAVDYFCDTYLEKFEIKYYFMKGKDGALISRLLKTYGFDFFCRLVDQIYVTNDEFIINKGKVTIGVLSACANKLTQEIINRKDMRSAFTEKERQSLKNIARGLGLDSKPLELKNE